MIFKATLYYPLPRGSLCPRFYRPSDLIASLSISIAAAAARTIMGDKLSLREEAVEVLRKRNFPRRQRRCAGVFLSLSSLSYSLRAQLLHFFSSRTGEKAEGKM